MFVKICGNTSEEDALLAVALGADAIGFIFAPSPRQVQPAFVREITHRIPPSVLTVGVFRDELPKRVIEIVQNTGLRAAQLHGRETPEDVAEVHRRIPYVIKAFSSGDENIKRADEYDADVIMIDNDQPGSGKMFDWNRTSDVPTSVQLLLAGGLNPDNVADAISQVHPWGVDVVSGVEAEPGKKDPRKLRAFIAAARQAENSASESDAADTLEDANAAPYDWQDEN